MVRRLFSGSTAALALGVSLLAPTTAQAENATTPVAGAPAARAAKANPWAAYFWKAGMVCTYDEIYSDGTSSSQLVVKKRTAKKVRVHWAGSSSQEWSAASGGKLVEVEHRVRDATTTDSREVYPTVAQARAGRGSTPLVTTRRVRYSAKEAKGFLVSGRTMTVTARYRVTGLGEKTITLPSGQVTAIGIGIRLRSITVTNVVKSEVVGVKDFYRDRIKAVEGGEWWSKGLGVVQWTSRAAGVGGTTTQRSCA